MASGLGTSLATTAGDRKMPDPIVVPMTTAKFESFVAQDYYTNKDITRILGNFTNQGLCHILRALVFEAHLRLPGYRSFTPLDRAYVHSLTARCNGYALNTLRAALDYVARLGGGIFTIVFLPIGLVIIASAFGYGMWTRTGTGAGGGETNAHPTTNQPLPHTSPRQSAHAPTSPEALADARRVEQ